MEPRFSVIIPSYNRAATLGRAIRSVLTQAFPAWEIIVVDDGSSDGTRELIEGYPGVRYHYQSNAGVCAARNNGADIATGDWLIFLDSDDELLPDAILEFNNFIIKNRDAKIIKAKYELIPPKVNETKYQIGIGFIPGSFSIERKEFLKVGKYDIRLKFAENTELIFRLDQIDSKMIEIEKVTLRYFESVNGGSKNLQNKLDSLLIILEKHNDYLSAHVKHLYHQNIGVIEMRFGRFEKARKHLWKSWEFKPKKISTLMRIALAYVPALARKIYSPEIGLR